MNNLSELIRLSRIKQEVIARETGVSQATISFWKSGKKTPTLENAIALSRVFSVSVGCIAGTEPIPDGYPDKCDISVLLQDPPKPESKPSPKSPFSKAQMDFLNEWKSDITHEIVAALKEDTSSSNEQGSGAS